MRTFHLSLVLTTTLLATGISAAGGFPSRDETMIEAMRPDGPLVTEYPDYTFITKMSADGRLTQYYFTKPTSAAYPSWEKIEIFRTGAVHRMMSCDPANVCRMAASARPASAAASAAMAWWTNLDIQTRALSAALYSGPECALRNRYLLSLTLLPDLKIRGTGLWDAEADHSIADLKGLDILASGQPLSLEQFEQAAQTLNAQSAVMSNRCSFVVQIQNETGDNHTYSAELSRIGEYFYRPEHKSRTPQS